MTLNEHIVNLSELEGAKSLDELSDGQIAFLEHCMHYHDTMVRFDATELLGRLEQNETVIRWLKQLIWDKNEIVASEACEAMRVVGDESCIDALLKRLNARSAMVRGYAVIAVADLCAVYNCKIDDVKQLLAYRMKHEKDLWVMQDYYCAMYLIGDYGYINHLIKGLRSENYLIRASTVSLIKDFVFDDEQSMQTVIAYALQYMDKATREYKDLMDAL